MSTTASFAEEVTYQWRALSYHGFGICANPACRRPAHCCGINPQSRICLGCFEFEYGCRAPNLNRRRND